MGIPVTIFSKIGDDANGAFLLRELGAVYNLHRPQTPEKLDQRADDDSAQDGVSAFELLLVAGQARSFVEGKRLATRKTRRGLRYASRRKVFMGRSWRKNRANHG